MVRKTLGFLLALWLLFVAYPAPGGDINVFAGKHYRGKGDVDYLELLEISRRLYEPDAELPNLSMLYTPAWNGFTEGPTWNGWWVQNTYGPTYCALPFIEEPYVTFLQDSQDLWFDQIGDGKRVGDSTDPRKRTWVAPEGALGCSARPGRVTYKAADGRTELHDWAMEFNAAAIVMQAELLLISRDPKAIAHYLPKLEKSADFIESRRDPKNNLFLVGPAGNIMAPSYAGWKRPDGTYDKAYLAGLSISYIAALDRLIEVEKLAGSPERAKLYAARRETARQGLPLLMTEEGYFINYLDPDGTKHGVYGAPKYGYFAAVPNHDAMAFRVVDDAQAKKIYAKIAAIPGLRPYDVIITNYPGLDDMYEKPQGLWRFGYWMNGGHWSTCEARMILGYYRVGKFEDARKSMKHILKFVYPFRMDNNLVDFGNAVYQPKQPINLVYDTWGIPAAMVRGLFEYLYQADGVRLVPHIPPGITELQQLDPIHFGRKRLYLSTVGTGPVTAVTVNGKPWKSFDGKTVYLPYNHTPDRADICIALGGEKPRRFPRADAGHAWISDDSGSLPPELESLTQQARRLAEFRSRLERTGFKDSYEVAHAQLALDAIAAAREHLRLRSEGKLTPLPPASQAAADKAYVDTAMRLCQGLDQVVKTYEKSASARGRKIFAVYQATARSRD
jgi:hypothetical protein